MDSRDICRCWQHFKEVKALMLTLLCILRQPAVQMAMLHTCCHNTKQQVCRVVASCLRSTFVKLPASLCAASKKLPNDCVCCLCDAEMYEHASQVTGRGPAPRPVMQQPTYTPIATQTSAQFAQSPALTPGSPSAPAPSYQDFESESEGSEVSGTPGEINTRPPLLSHPFVRPHGFCH